MRRRFTSNKYFPINTDNYMTIEALEDGLSACLSTNACEYCIDGDGNWKSLAAGIATEIINSGHTLSFRGELTSNSSNGIGTFAISKKCNLKGNCMSLLFGDNAADNSSLNSSWAFYKLFYNCTNIINVSSNFLPATTLTHHCYEYMFESCKGLINSPELPATNLKDSCYYAMFARTNVLPDCSNINFTSINVVYSNGLRGLFKNTKVTDNDLNRILPKNSNGKYCLPVMPLSELCYDNMFEGCTSLTTAPELPATVLAESCYLFMFEDCSNLINAPELPAISLERSCYEGMFYGCKKLNYIKMLATDISANRCLSNWVNNVASAGTFVKSSAMNSLPTGIHGIPEGWTVVNDGEESVNIDNYLTIEALEDGLTASLSTNACEYCVDGDGNWKSLAAGVATESINTGQTLSFRGNLTPVSDQGIGTFTISNKCNLKGNCMSMLFGNKAANNYSLSSKDYAFYKLFYSCSNIVTVSENFLPATTLANYCYGSMFYNCRIKTAPKLPAMTLADSCYESMFYMSSLTTAPELPATTLANKCYYQMFYSCMSLTAATELPATTLADYCYAYMFGYTRFTTAPELPATTLADYCYYQMFYLNRYLITAPSILPATTLTDYCYYGMFYNCGNLTNVPELPATTLATSCYEWMFKGCTSLTTAPVLPATTLATSCYSRMFQDCTSLTSAPALPATTLTDYCYSRMFSSCSKLRYIKMLAMDISATGCLDNWVADVASPGTFVKNSDMTTLPTGAHGIPSGWTVEDDYNPQECVSLSITADDVLGSSIRTTIHWEAVTNGTDSNGNVKTGVVLTGTAISEEFPQNTSETETVTRTISYTYLGVTATTSITQDIWIRERYIVNLNNQWQLSTAVSNPSSSTYEGVYESFSNRNIHDSYATMTIDIMGYKNFKLYIRSYAESNYDYVMVSQLDQTITGSTIYNDTILVKAHTRGNQQSGTALSNYKLVEFANIDGGEHTITIVYRKDGSASSGNDRGYVLIPKNQ